MRKNDFVALTIQQQVELVNDYLAQDKSMIDIFKREKLIEIDESSVRKRFVKNGYKHDKEKNKYIKINDNTLVNNDVEYSQNTPQVVSKKEYPSSNTLVVPKEKTERLLKLVDQQPELEELLKWWKTEKNIIDIPEITLNKTELTGEIMGKTFKTYKCVIDKFLKFCDKHGEYTQRDMVAMALLEYIQKYK